MENKKRKILEIYITTNGDEVAFDVEKTEESEMAEVIMRMVLEKFLEVTEDLDTTLDYE